MRQCAIIWLFITLTDLEQIEQNRLNVVSWKVESYVSFLSKYNVLAVLSCCYTEEVESLISFNIIG